MMLKGVVCLNLLLQVELMIELRLALMKETLMIH